MKKCPVCNRIYKDNDYYCLNDNHRLQSYSREQSFADQKTVAKNNSLLNPHCPTCNSTNVKKISELRRGAHAVAWGLFSTTARSQFECKNCGYKW